MKHAAVVFLFVALCAGFAFSQAGETTIIETQDGSSNDPYSFLVYSETKGHAKIDLAFNELTGVLRATYSIADSELNEADAVIAVRDSVAAFARSRGYMRVRAYPDDDVLSYSPDGETAYLRRFYILYEKSGMQ